MTSFATPRTATLVAALALASLTFATPLRAAQPDGATLLALLARADQMFHDRQLPAAAQLYRMLLRLDPDHQHADQRLLELGSMLPPTDPPRELETLAQSFPSGTKLLKTRHFLIVYDTPDSWADARASLLERAVETFYRQMRGAGWKPQPLQHRMVALLFNDHRAYLAYARQTERTELAESGGYYSSLTNRIALFSNHTNPQLRGLVEQIAHAENAISVLDQRIAQLGRTGDAAQVQHLANQRSRAIVQLSQLRNHYQRAAGLNNISQSFHEAVHQLAYNTGIQYRGIPYPLWFSEGLATSFETANPALPYGPAEANVFRRRALVAAARRNALLPLDQLVAIREMPDGLDRSELYGQAWGLFHWLFRTHPQQLRQYQILLNTQPAGDDGARLARFESAFGPVAQVQHQWLAWVATLR